MNKSWMPTTAGILSIICGAAELLLSLVVLIMGTILGSLGNYFPNIAQGQFPTFAIILVLTLIAAKTLIIGILALIGGIFALRKKVWGMTLAGSIASCFTPFWVLGVGSVVFTILGRSEFK